MLAFARSTEGLALWSSQQHEYLGDVVRVQREEAAEASSLRAGFVLLDAAPAYLGFVTEQVYLELKEQLTVRLR